MTLAWIGIGSNQDNPRAQVERAVVALDHLPDSRLAGVSPWYGSHAVGPGQQPDYVNGVACLDTGLSPKKLLTALQAIEAAQGRVRGERWAARTIDLDILLFGHCVIQEPELIVPHPRLLERPFVIKPLLALCPDLALPDGRSLREITAGLSCAGTWLLEPAP